MTELTHEILKLLAEPFPDDCIEFKPGATTRDKKKALALAYVEVRHYIDRLNDVIGGDWSDEYQFINPSGELIACGLTICGVTRFDIGEKNSSDINTATSALAQSFKRACVKFGLGRYLYAIESVWVAYDAERKQFTDQAQTQLRKKISGASPKPGWQPATKGETDDPNQEAEPSKDSRRDAYIGRINELNGQLAEPNEIDLDGECKVEMVDSTMFAFGSLDIYQSKSDIARWLDDCWLHYSPASIWMGLDRDNSRTSQGFTLWQEWLSAAEIAESIMPKSCFE